MNAEPSKNRLDVGLTLRGLVRSRSHARDLVKRGQVKVNGVVILKPGTLIDVQSEIFIDEDTTRVGRGGLKLEKALSEFNIDCHVPEALDVGASTGGFTQTLLEKGVEKVTALDVGRDQLAASLLNHPRVVNLEQTDIRDAVLPHGHFHLIVCDLSFISLRLVLPAMVKLGHKDSHYITLFKPQFEVGSNHLNKRGLASNLHTHRIAMQDLFKWVKSSIIDLHPWDYIRSPILGKEGNCEYLIHWRKTPAMYDIQEKTKAFWRQET